MRQCMLTTMDNVYNPFTHPDEWLAFDDEKGYRTNRWLARCSLTSSNLDEEDYDQEFNDAIDRFLLLNPYGIHYKLYEDEASVMIPLANKVYKELYKEKQNK